ncbi:MAG: PAS domain S-box protein [Nitrospirae bacterium]|nr:PAS domain S-box protein [Nitrospirota bacterium]
MQKTIKQPDPECQELKRVQALLENKLSSTIETVINLQSMIDNIPFGIAYLDKDFRFIRINKVLEDMLNTSTDSLAGKLCYESVGEYADDDTRHGEDKICSFCKVNECSSLKKSTVFERPFHGKFFRVTAIPEFDEDGNIYRFIGIVEDISRQKQYETRILRNSQINSAIASILKVSMETVPLKNRFEKILGLIFSVPLLSVMPIGAIFLVDDKDNSLHLMAHKGFTEPMIESCRSVMAGECLCGKAAMGESIIFDACSDNIHKDKSKYSHPHSHYCVPIISESDTTYGVLTLYLEENHLRSDEEEKFLILVANTLSLIIKRSLMEEVISDSEERFRNIFNAAPDAMFIGDKDTGIIVDANLSAENLLMMKREEIIGMHFTRLHPPYDEDNARQRFQRHITQLKSGKPPLPLENQVIRADATCVWTEVIAQSITLNNKECVIGVFRDITMRRKYEMEEKLLIQQSKMAAMGDMIAAIAHQWKQPLNSLSLFVQDIRDAYEFGELDGVYIDTAVKNSMHQIDFMARTIEVFRNFFMPSIQKETFDILGVTSEVFSMLSSQLKTNSISYSITCHTHNRTFGSFAEVTHCDAASITTYKNQLAHVILNIINNAKDAIIQRRKLAMPGVNEDGPANTPITGGRGVAADGSISVDFERYGETVKLSISDNGGGIPVKIIDKIFEPYFTTKSEGQGTGIGLYMSKIIVEDKLGGKIHVRNIEGGTVFTLEFTGRQSA